jgi:hypothetical protein
LVFPQDSGSGGRFYNLFARTAARRFSARGLITLRAAASAGFSAFFPGILTRRSVFITFGAKRCAAIPPVLHNATNGGEISEVIAKQIVK